MQFNPKILGLNVVMFGTEFQTIIGLSVLFLCVIAGKMNNKLVM